MKERLISKLLEFWKLKPEQRLGQLLEEVTGGALWYIQDTTLLRQIEECIDGIRRDGGAQGHPPEGE